MEESLRNRNTDGFECRSTAVEMRGVAPSAFTYDLPIRGAGAARPVPARIAARVIRARAGPTTKRRNRSSRAVVVGAARAWIHRRRAGRLEVTPKRGRTTTPRLQGVMIGAPIGAVLGAVLGWHLTKNFARMSSVGLHAHIDVGRDLGVKLLACRCETVRPSLLWSLS